MMKSIRIGSGAGYAGDRLEPSLELIEKGNLDYISYECLAERTIAIGQQAKLKDPSKGYNGLLAHRMEKLKDTSGIQAGHRTDPVPSGSWQCGWNTCPAPAHSPAMISASLPG